MARRSFEDSPKTRSMIVSKVIANQRPQKSGKMKDKRNAAAKCKRNHRGLAVGKKKSIVYVFRSTTLIETAVSEIFIRIFLKISPAAAVCMRVVTAACALFSSHYAFSHHTPRFAVRRGRCEHNFQDAVIPYPIEIRARARARQCTRKTASLASLSR